MARVAVKHKNIQDPDAKKRPVRDLIPEGRYLALTIKAVHGSTHAKLSKVTVEYQLVNKVDDEGNEVSLAEGEKKVAGRRAFQDYVLEENVEYPGLTETQRHELVMMLDACEAPYDADGFDTDDVEGKSVFITIKHRPGNKKDDDGNDIIFENVKRVESSTPIDENDLV